MSIFVESSQQYYCAVMLVSDNLKNGYIMAQSLYAHFDFKKWNIEYVRHAIN